jgi:hypothetical protein
MYDMISTVLLTPVTFITHVFSYLFNNLRGKTYIIVFLLGVNRSILCKFVQEEHETGIILSIG